MADLLCDHYNRKKIMVHLNIENLNTKTRSIHAGQYFAVTVGDFDGIWILAKRGISTTLQCDSLEGSKMLEEYGGISGRIVTPFLLANFTNYSQEISKSENSINIPYFTNPK